QASSLLRLRGVRGGFLRDAMLGLADFLFDFGNLVGFHIGGGYATPFFQRLFPLRRRKIHAPAFCVHVTQMGMNCWIVRFARSSFAQRVFGLGVLSLLVVNPAEAV